MSIIIGKDKFWLNKPEVVTFFLSLFQKKFLRNNFLNILSQIITQISNKKMIVWLKWPNLPNSMFSDIAFFKKNI